MDHQEKKLLEVTARLAQENNAMLKKIRRAMLWSRTLKVVYWVVAIGIAFGAYYFIQPYIEQLFGAYKGFQQGIQNIQDAGSRIPNFGDLFGGDGV